MIVTCKLTEKQLRQCHNLMLNCNSKREMFIYLIDIGINGDHALIMSNSFVPVKTGYTVLSIVSQVAHRTY